MGEEHLNAFTQGKSSQVFHGSIRPATMDIFGPSETKPGYAEKALSHSLQHPRTPTLRSGYTLLPLLRSQHRHNYTSSPRRASPLRLACKHCPLLADERNLLSQQQQLPEPRGSPPAGLPGSHSAALCVHKIWCSLCRERSSANAAERGFWQRDVNWCVISGSFHLGNFIYWLFEFYFVGQLNTAKINIYA